MMGGNNLANWFVAAVGSLPVLLFANVEAQSQSDPNAIGAIGGALAAGGFSLWYGWYVTTTTIPRIVKDFREEAEADRGAFERQMGEERKLFREEMAENRRISQQQIAFSQSLVDELRKRGTE